MPMPMSIPMIGDVVTVHGPRGSRGCRHVSDRGSTSLQIVLLTPVLVLLMFAGWQAALWNHARTEARVIARETAVLVARDGLPASAAVIAAETSLDGSDLVAPVVDIVSDGQLVTVTITGQAPGILRGTTKTVTVRASVSATGWVPL